MAMIRLAKQAMHNLTQETSKAKRNLVEQYFKKEEKAMKK